MVRSHTVMVWRVYLPKKSLVVVSGWWQTKFCVRPGPGLWSLVLGPFGPDLGPDQDLTWDLDLDLSLTIISQTSREIKSIACYTLHATHQYIHTDTKANVISREPCLIVYLMMITLEPVEAVKCK